MGDISAGTPVEDGARVGRRLIPPTNACRPIIGDYAEHFDATPLELVWRMRDTSRN